MSRHEIPARWKNAVRQYVRATSGEERDHLTAYDFPENRAVQVRFPDGSHAFFRYAFHLRDERGDEVAVFTGHCGYYFLSADDLEVEVLETVSHEVPAEMDWDA